MVEEVARGSTTDPQHNPPLIHWRQAADDPVLWPLRLRRRLQWPVGLSGLLVFVLWLGLFALLAPWPADAAGVTSLDVERLGSALFFALSIAFLLEIAGIVLPAAQRDISELRPLLRLPDDEFQRLRDGLVRYSPYRLRVVSSLGVLIGLGHAHMLGNLSLQAEPAGLSLAFALATVAIWVLMMQLASPLIRNAGLFSALGRDYTRLDLYNPHHLLPYGRAALRPILLLLGLQALYPLITLGGTTLNPWVWAGLTASFLLMVWLFVMPLRGIHAAVKQRRERLLSDLDTRLAHLWRADGHEPPDHGQDTLARSAVLLDLRERLRGVSSWPLGSALVKRILLYGIIPPLGWSAAVFMDILIKALV